MAAPVLSADLQATLLANPSFSASIAQVNLISSQIGAAIDQANKAAEAARAGASFPTANSAPVTWPDLQALFDAMAKALSTSTVPLMVRPVDNSVPSNGENTVSAPTTPAAAPTPVATTPIASEPASSQPAPSNELQSTVLSVHNALRYTHQAGPLQWSSELAAGGQDYAQRCVWGHSGVPGLGENLAIGFPDVRAAMQAWAVEESLYVAGEPTPSNFEDVGHYTQMVWTDTTHVGCGYAYCGNRGWYLVCRYSPPGNVEGTFPQHVLARTS